MKHWWTERNPFLRRQLRESSTPTEDEAARLMFLPARKRRREKRKPRATNSELRARCLALCEQVEQLNEDRQRRDTK